MAQSATLMALSKCVSNSVSDVSVAHGSLARRLVLFQVVAVLSQLLDRLPAHVFMEEPPMPLASPMGDDANIPAADGGGDVPADPNEAFRRYLIKELLDTERQYVRDLEIMQVHNFSSQDDFLFPASKVSHDLSPLHRTLPPPFELRIS